MEHESDELIHKKGRHRKKQLFNSILQQMEFYFSDSNLAKDRYLSSLLKENTYVDITEFLKFNKITKLTTNIDDIRKAIKKSEVIELSEDQEKIQRKTPVKVKENVEECTLYVERINSDATHDFLTTLFSDFGTVVYVSIPKYKHNHINKGFAFIEYENEKDAENAIGYFESIGCKMSSNVDPGELCSISTFIKENQKGGEDIVEKEEVPLNDTSHKRKYSDGHEAPAKKLRTEQNNEVLGENMTDPIHSEDCEGKKKKKKEHKKKTLIKELGLQVLSKREWKKMRNRYLDLQRKKMKEFKIYLNRAKFSSQNYNTKDKVTEPTDVCVTTEEKSSKLEYVPGIIVKLKLPEPCLNEKKLKNDIKSSVAEVKYVDVPLPAGSEEVFIRFADNESAIKFCNQEFVGIRSLLEDNEEKAYWEKIENDRKVKFKKGLKKQRGKDKLLKRAEKELGKHTRFDDNE